MTNTYVTTFKSTDTGAGSVSGTSGTLLTILDETLIIGRVFTTANDSAFTDRSAEARLDGGTAFVLFETPATGDRAYFGMSVKFARLIFDLATLGVGGAFVWEYWNGSWTTLSVTDGTSGFTQDGTVTWTSPSDWVTTSINSATRYWVRVRPSSAPSTNPTVNSVSYLGWLQAFTGTNKTAYKQNAKTGYLQFFMRVQDDAPGAAGAREARVNGFEAMTDVDTGTGRFPQASQGVSPGVVIARKSSTADGTARAWLIIADGRTVYVFILTTDVASAYYAWKFGDIYSYVPNDQYGLGVTGRMVENSITATAERLGEVSALGTSASYFAARSYTGVGSGIIWGKHQDYLKGGSGHLGTAGLPYTNPADGKFWVSPVWVTDIAQSVLRGQMRGLWAPLHANANFNDGDIIPGSGDLAGRTFMIVKIIYNSASSSGSVAMETSDTWETN